MTRRGVLDDITFVAEPGEFVALVGPSGSGKTTLVSLIPGSTNLQRGGSCRRRGRVDGIELGPLRRQVALVLQEAVMLSGTIRDNLR